MADLNPRQFQSDPKPQRHTDIANHYASLPRDHPDRPAAKQAFENSLRRMSTARKRKYG